MEGKGILKMIEGEI